MPAEVTVYRRGPDNEAIPVTVDSRNYGPPGYCGWDRKALTAPTGPGLDPEDVLKRLDDLTRRVEKLEKEMRPLLGVFRRR